jgi:hypothetical protein
MYINVTVEYGREPVDIVQRIGYRDDSGAEGIEIVGAVQSISPLNQVELVVRVVHTEPRVHRAELLQVEHLSAVYFDDLGQLVYAGASIAGDEVAAVDCDIPNGLRRLLSML